MRAFFVLPLLLLIAGCVSSTDPVGTPPNPPDAATVALLTGTWVGLTENTEGLLDALELEFFPSGEDLRVRVSLNGSELATAYTAVTGDRITIDAATIAGDSASFDATLNRAALRMDGAFFTLVGGTEDGGIFFVEKN